MLYELNEEKLKKEGFVTVKSLLNILNKDADQIKSIVVSTLNENGELNVYTAMDDSTFKLIGLLEGSKQILLESIYK